MQKFLLAYHGGKQFETKEEGQQHMANWKAWMAGLGDAVVDPGLPVGPSKTVSKDGITNDGGPNPLSGITILQAETEDQALQMAGDCPHVKIGGSIEVAPAMNMEM